MSSSLFTDPDSARALFRVMHERAAAAGVTLRPPPEEPTTCCGRGCNGCVWEGFLSAADYWWQESQWQLEAAL